MNKTTSSIISFLLIGLVVFGGRRLGLGLVERVIAVILVLGLFELIKNKLKKMKNLEKFIYSVKYLPPVLYFGTVAWLIYTFYYGDYLENEIQIFGYVWDGSSLEDIFVFWFLYITYLAAKNLKTKE
jgi:hypothetical protein